LSYASMPPEKNRAATGLAHGLSRQEFLLLHEKYSTEAGRFKTLKMAEPGLVF